MISYAQNFEDVLLSRCFRDVTEGFYVDVGAYDPVIDSVTKHFYDRGWSGINIEPGSVFSRLADDRPRDINLKLAVSGHSGMVTLYEYPEYPGLSTLEEELPAALRDIVTPRIELTVPCATLNEILAKHAMGKTIQFLKVDVEGHEQSIISSTDWRLFRPEVLIVEATIPTTAKPSDLTWEAILVESGFRFAYFDGLNRFYTRSESDYLGKFFALPVNIFDGFVKYDPQITHLESALAQAREQSAHAQTSLARAEDDLAVSRQDTITLRDSLARTEDELAVSRQETKTIKDSFTRAEDQLARSSQQIDLLQASLTHAERELAHTRHELSTLRRTLSDLESWRSQLIGKLELSDGPPEIRSVLPLARIIRTVLPRGKSEVRALDLAAHPGRKKRGPRRKLKKALKRVRRLGRQTFVAAARRTIAPAAAWFAQRFPKVFAKLRKDIRNRIGGEAAQAVLPPAPTIPPQVLEDALLTIALSQNRTPADTAALLSRRDTE